MAFGLDAVVAVLGGEGSGAGVPGGMPAAFTLFICDGAKTLRKLTQMIDYSWRGSFTNAELNALHAEGFDHKVLDDDWVAQVSRHSLGWVCARDGEGVVG